MDDLELTRLCAEAMGYHIHMAARYDFGKTEWVESPKGFRYDPLHNDALAMMLVKRFRMGIDDAGKHGDKCGASMLVGPLLYTAVADDLNRAIVECVAKMQQAQVSQPV